MDQPCEDALRGYLPVLRGDGVTDETEALQQWVDVGAQPPPGTYKISAALAARTPGERRVRCAYCQRIVATQNEDTGTLTVRPNVTVTVELNGRLCCSWHVGIAEQARVAAAAIAS